MSIQKACINCQYCYNRIEHQGDHQHYYAYEYRIPAMTALEEAGRAMTPLLNIPNKKPEQVIEECLTACMQCDFKSPKIADLIAREINPDREQQ